jgi:adenylate kinase family enzyme
MAGRYAALLLIGPPGSGKTFLGRRLAECGVAAFTEIEPLLRERFGGGDAFEARLREAGEFVWRSYQAQLRSAEGPVAFESAGVTDRVLLERLAREHRIAFVHVRTPRALCVERVVSRSGERNIHRTTDGERIGRHYDLWQEKVEPSFRFDLRVDGDDADGAVAAIRELLRGAGAGAPPEYVRQDSSQTLREGLAEYRARNPGLLDAAAMEGEAAALFRQHDAAHVLFGCETTLRGETLVDTWTIFASSIGLRGYLAYLKLPQVNQVFAEAGIGRVALVSARCLPDALRVVWRSRRVVPKWPWTEYERYLDRPLRELRDEFRIRVV